MQVQNELKSSFAKALIPIFAFYNASHSMSPQQRMRMSFALANDHLPDMIYSVNLFLRENNMIILNGNNHDFRYLLETQQYLQITKQFPHPDELGQLINEFFARHPEKLQLPKAADLLSYLHPSVFPAAAGPAPIMATNPPANTFDINGSLFFDGKQLSQSRRRKRTTVDDDKLYLEAIRRVYNFYVEQNKSKLSFTSLEIFEEKKLYQCTKIITENGRKDFVGDIKKILRINGFIKFKYNSACSVELTDKKMCSDDKLAEMLDTFREEKNAQKRKYGHKK